MADAASFLAALGPQGAAPSPAQDDAPAPVEVSSPSAGAEGVAAGWELPLDHLSASSFGMWARCPEQWRQRYVLGRKEAPGAALVLGTGFHKAMEHNFRQKIDSHEDLKVEEIVEAFHHGWDSDIERYGGVNEVVWGNDKPDTLRARGASLTTIYREQVTPRLQPQSVELPVTVVLREIPVPIVGYVDYVGTRETGVPWDDGYESDELCVDYKTSGKAVSKMKEDWGIQSRLYTIATGLPIEYHVAVKTATPKVQTAVDVPGLRMEVSDPQAELLRRQLARYVAQMRLYYERFGPDQAWPTGAPFYGWACGYCGFSSTCVWRQS